MALPQLSILVPCFNEAANLPELVRRLRATLRQMEVVGEILLVDDGSTDETARVVAELADQFHDVRGLRHAANRGLFAAWQTALREAQGRYVAVIDADLQYQPEDVASLWDHLHWTHCDIAQGARVNVWEAGSLRFWLSRGLNALLNLVFRMSLHDNKSGFFLTRREVAQEMLSYGERYFYPQTFVMVSAHARGFSIGEVRTVFARREQGQSFIRPVPIKTVALSLVDIARALPEFRWRGPRRTDLRQHVARFRPAPQTKTLSTSCRRKLARYAACMPLHHWMITSDAVQDFDDLEQTQWLAPEAIEALQNERLRQLVQHAYRHSRFYRRRMDEAGIRPEQVQSIADLAALPPLTKDDIRRNLYIGLLADNARIGDLYPIKTSGSTGEPLSIYVDRQQLNMRWATTLRAHLWTGYSFGDRCVRLWHQTIGMSRSQIVKERLDAWWTRRLFIPAWEMRLDNLAATVARIVGHRPTLIEGYAESLNLLAHYLAEHPVRCPELRAIMSSAQTLSRSSREIIEQTFGAPVYDKYGAREFSGIAYQCEQRGAYHVMGESYIVEIVKDGRPARPGEIGEVLITDLNNRCLPLLRYRIGDLARATEPTPCACGRGLPLMGEIMGRTQSIIIGEGNHFVPGSFFAHLLKEYDYAIGRFQVYQNRDGVIELRIVKGGRFSQSVLDEILEQLHRYLGRSARIEVRFVDTIETVRTGKFRYSISELAFDFQTSRIEPAPLVQPPPAVFDADDGSFDTHGSPGK